MAANPILPRAQAPIAGQLPTTREWYEFFRQLLVFVGESSSIGSVIAEILGRLAALEQEGGDPITAIQGLASVSAYGPFGGIVRVELFNDSLSPAATYYYGTSAAGTKGWHAVADTLAAAPGELTKTVEADGVSTFGLADLADTGVGAALVKITRDAKGRVEGTEAATTDDLPEGTANLYFTNDRADARIEVQKGIAGGIAPLGGDTKIPIEYIPAAVLGQVSYQGNWDASAGTPPTITPEKGWYYIVTVAGSTNLDGITDWKVGDWAIHDGTAWTKVDNTDAIASWNGRTGAVVPLAGDYTPAQVGAEPSITAGTTAQYWRGDKTWRDFATDVRAAVLTGLSTATNAAIAATDTVLQALGKLQAQVSARVLKAGDTMSGDLSIARSETSAASAPSLIVSNTSASATNEAHYDMVSDGLLARIYWRKAASPTLGYYIDLNDGSGPSTRLRFTSAGWNIENANLSVSGNRVMDAADALASGLLSVSPTVTDLDAMVGSTARFFRAAGGSTGIPAAVAGSGGVGLYIPYTASIGSQFWHATTSNRMFMRGYNGGWNAWKEITAA